MGKRPIFLFIVVLWLAACDPGQGERLDDGPQLLQDVTLVLTTPAPTRVLSPTPSPIIIPISTSELISPLQVPTQEVDFLLVTPTLPPSKTPTLTPTRTPTFMSPPPTLTPNFIPNFIFVPTGAALPNQIVPIPTAITNAPSSTCATPWFFTQPLLPNCPTNAPLLSSGSFQQFQSGFMLWVQQQDAIYVLYDSANFPRWQVFNDAFQEGMPDTDPAYDNPPPYTWQPKRGFGLLWRNQLSARERLGWAVIEWETAYQLQVQLDSDGTIYLSEPRGGIFSLTPDGSEWKRYE